MPIGVPIRPSPAASEAQPTAAPPAWLGIVVVVSHPNVGLFPFRGLVRLLHWELRTCSGRRRGVDMQFSSFGIKRSTLARWTCSAAVASFCIAQAATASPAAAWSTHPSGPAGFSYVVGEGGTVNLSGVNDVAYGANGKFTYEYAVAGSVSCSNSTFGDPNKGVRKACFVKPVVGPSGFSFVTSEYNQFTISGVADVAYGDSGKYDYKYAMSGSVDCTNQVFGNPDNGVRKACFVKP
ncbi:MAG: hypothetical protein ACLPVY_08805 [Acidimicrobiia bacterium]